jgi:hypothetical protein
LTDPPESADLISTLGEARAFYASKLAGSHKIACHGKDVTIVFERQATHLFSVELDDDAAIPVAERVNDGRGGTRRFSLERARNMDRVLPAVSQFTVSVPGTGPGARQNKMLHGTRLPDGSYMRVVLRPGPGAAFTCVSAYTISQHKWMEMRRAKSAKFPP